MALTGSWDFILTDLLGTVHGELHGASDRSVALPHLRIPTASFKIPLWHPMVAPLVSGPCLLQAWRTNHLSNRRLVFNGEINAVNEQSDNTTQSVAATAVGPFSRLTNRLIGTTKAGIKFPASGEIDLGLIAHNILDTVNGQEFTGISKGTLTASQNGATGLWYLKNAAEAIAELTTGLNSFEFGVTPTIPTVVGGLGGWPQIGLMDIAPFIGGAQRPDAIFEYGARTASVSSYERAITRSGMLTRGYISVSGWPDSTELDILTSTNTTARTANGLYEGLVPDAGITDTGLRQQVLDYHLSIRSRPREIVTFKPAVNSRPSPLVDFEVGDFVRARAEVRGVVRFDSMFRVWGVTFNIDNNGNENVELELVMP